MDAQAMVMAGVPVMGAICAVALYVVRQEIKGDVNRLDGRINTQQALHQRLAEDVSYIRSRIDRALNGHA